MTAAAVNTPAGTDAAAQSVTEDDGPLSPWWMRRAQRCSAEPMSATGRRCS